MPRYDYRCAGGHVREIVAGYEDAEIPCPECGHPAQRMPFCEGVAIQGETVAKPGKTQKTEALDKYGRYRLDAFENAHNEILESCQRQGKPVPDLRKVGMERARRVKAATK